jgi:hypothetical protein
MWKHRSRENLDSLFFINQCLMKNKLPKSTGLLVFLRRGMLVMFEGGSKVNPFGIQTQNGTRKRKKSVRK